MSRLGLLAIAALLGAASPAAALTSQELSSVRAAPPPGARLPLGTPVVTGEGKSATLGSVLAGRPTLFVFADYRCRYLCGPAASLAADALTRSGLRPGADYRFVIMGLDPGEGPATARRFETERLAAFPKLWPATEMLSAGAPAIRKATEALGYHYLYDPERGQYAHPAAAYVLTPAGQVTRVLPPLDLQTGDLAGALRAARGEAVIPTLVQRLHALCYPFDPTRGRYNGQVLRLLQAGGLGLIAVAGAAFLWTRRRSRRA